MALLFPDEPPCWPSTLFRPGRYTSKPDSRPRRVMARAERRRGPKPSPRRNAHCPGLSHAATTHDAVARQLKLRATVTKSACADFKSPEGDLVSAGAVSTAAIVGIPRQNAPRRHDPRLSAPRSSLCAFPTLGVLLTPLAFPFVPFPLHDLRLNDPRGHEEVTMTLTEGALILTCIYCGHAWPESLTNLK